MTSGQKLFFVPVVTKAHVLAGAAMLTCAAVAFDVPPFSTFGRLQAPRSVEWNLPSTAADELRTSLPSPLAIYRPEDSAISEQLATTQKVDEVEEHSFATLAAR